jgi:Holliday junction DNA helicase RuvA
MALQVLSVMSPKEFAAAIERQDAGALKRVKGIGEKTAKRIVLELKGAKTQLYAMSASISGATAEKKKEAKKDNGDAAEAAEEANVYDAFSIINDAREALKSLGMNEEEAYARVESALLLQEKWTLEELIRAALQNKAV